MQYGVTLQQEKEELTPKSQSQIVWRMEVEAQSAWTEEKGKVQQQARRCREIYLIIR